MKSSYGLLAALMALQTACSTIQQTSTYRVAEPSDEARPVCTLFHSTNGAALVTFPEAYLVIDPGRPSRTLLMGPPLIPFIPFGAFSDKTTPSLRVQVFPRSGKRIEVLLDQLKVSYDDRPVAFNFGSYRKKGSRETEVTTGLLKDASLMVPFQVDVPSDLNLDGVGEIATPETIWVAFPIRSPDSKREIRLKFEREKKTRYMPFVAPDVGGPVACETELPEVGKNRSFF